MSSRIQRPAPTRLDRLISYISPERGLRRLQARAALRWAGGGYSSARTDLRSTKEWRPGAGSANADTLDDLNELRGRSRDLVRNNPLASGAINTAVTNVIGTGLTLQSRIDRTTLGLEDEDADAWERRAELLFAIWSARKEADITRSQTVAGLQDLVFRSTLESGDVFVLRRFRKRKGDLLSTKLQVIEADRVCNPEMKFDTDELAGGVESDVDGAPLAYHVLNRHPGDYLSLKADEWTRIPAFSPRTGERQTLHVYRKLRPGLTRGVPFLAPVIETLKQLDTYGHAELDATVISSFFTAFVTTESGDEGLPGIEPADPNAPSEADGYAPEVKMGPAAVVGLAPGEAVTFANPNRPNQAFEPFVLAFLRQVAAGTEIPFELLIKHFTASYSASRAALLEAWKFFRGRREWVTTEFCTPVYGWFLEDAIASGLLQAPGFFADPIVRAAWSGAEWTGPAQGQIDPLKEILAAEKRLELVISTLDEETAAITGGDWERKFRQRVKEVRMLENAGLPALPSSSGAVNDAAVDTPEEAAQEDAA